MPSGVDHHSKLPPIESPIKHSIALFASGTGSNAAKVIEYFKDHEKIQVKLVVSNRRKAGVHEIARTKDIPSLHITRETFQNDPAFVLQQLEEYEIDFIALAGFLLLVPDYLVARYTKHMVNIHPALLPKFGGKGMYGMHVHRAVKEAGVVETGMTIHYVDSEYDEGNIIFQASCMVKPSDTADEIQKKVLQLEHKHYAPVIESLLISDRIYVG